MVVVVAAAAAAFKMTPTAAMPAGSAMRRRKVGAAAQLNLGGLTGLGGNPSCSATWPRGGKLLAHLIDDQMPLASRGREIPMPFDITKGERVRYRSSPQRSRAIEHQVRVMVLDHQRDALRHASRRGGQGCLCQNGNRGAGRQ
eukprot:g15529.t1